MEHYDHRIHVKVTSGAAYQENQLRKLARETLGMHQLRINAVPSADSKQLTQLIISAPDAALIVAVRAKLEHRLRDGRTLVEVVGGGATPPKDPQPGQTGGAPHGRTPEEVVGGGSGLTAELNQGHVATPPTGLQPPPIGPQPPHVAGPQPPHVAGRKPFGFVALPPTFAAGEPVWHDGTSRDGRVSGEVRFELQALTPLLVGWERAEAGKPESTDWPVPSETAAGLAKGKAVLCPLRAPWGERPVIIPGDTLKGLLRHELGALLGAPMERVAERSYSYRPNAMYPAVGSFLWPRLALVPKDVQYQVVQIFGKTVRVPMELLVFDHLERSQYPFDAGNGHPYHGGQGAGAQLNAKHGLHTSVRVTKQGAKTTRVPISDHVRQQYVATVLHLTDTTFGHFSNRHPDVPTRVTGDHARSTILAAAADKVFAPGDIVWVEWDTSTKQVVSLGWHFRYRWAYVDTVRRVGIQRSERQGLFPTEEERIRDDVGAPQKLSSVRRIFGYTGDNEGSEGIGTGDYTQLMGRVSINAGLEVINANDTEAQRFVHRTFLKELGMPRPSAVEHYLSQPCHPNKRPGDNASLVTYGDADGYDKPGELAGRKFYLDRKDAYDNQGRSLVPGPAGGGEGTEGNNDRSTLACEASRPGRSFRFTLRFRDLEHHELAAMLIALCPNQFSTVLGGNHAQGYCSKLGYARPLGWGSVNITAVQLLWLDEAAEQPQLNRHQGALVDWVKGNHKTVAMQGAWLDIHRRWHPAAGDYPRGNGGAIYSYHANLRSSHSRLRRKKSK